MSSNEKKREYLRKWRKRNKELNMTLENIEPNNIEATEQCTDTESNNFEAAAQFTDHVQLSPDLDSSESDITLSDIESLSDDESSESDFLFENCDHNDEEVQEKNFSAELAKWILDNRITRAASNELLVILRQNGHGDLPKCTRTILQTPRNVLSEKKCGGDYIYLGIARGINRTINAKPQHNFGNKIFLIVNVDGVPLFKSSPVQIWPILGMFDNLSPFIVAVYVGNSKPSNLDEFLQDFTNECRVLSENGIEIEGHILEFEVRAFVCDAPARQFLKGIVSHNAYNGCERCTVEGFWVSSRMTFVELNCDLRDDESFRNNLYMGKHQKQISILCNSGIQCIKQFPLDYMHLVCLGVVKRILLTWKIGPRHQKLSPRLLTQISNSLEALRGKMPSEFARQPRGLDHVKRWKATEYRQFLLYTGLVVLKNVISPEIYSHFVCLSIAIGIMVEECDHVRHEHLGYARDLLRYFVSSCSEFYGNTFPVYNVHNLIHLWEDCHNFNTPLDKISSFPFENYLQVVKKFVRNSQNPLAQIVKRVGELENLALSDTSQKSATTKISNTVKKDSWFFLISGEFAEIKELDGENSFACDVIYKRFHQSLFVDPCDSKKFNIVYIRNAHNICRRKYIQKEDILRKAVCLPYKEGFVIRPLFNNIV